METSNSPKNEDVSEKQTSQVEKNTQQNLNVAQEEASSPTQALPHDTPIEDRPSSGEDQESLAIPGRHLSAEALYQEEKEQEQEEHFLQIQTEYHQLVRQLTQDPSLTTLREPLEKIHQAYLASRENEKRLTRKCRELHAEVLADVQKVQGAIKMNQEDRSTIAGLKKEINKAWRMVEASNEKENKAKEVIQSLKSELSQASKQHPETTEAQLESIKELIEEKEKLQNELQLTKKELDSFKEQNYTLQEKNRQFQLEQSEYEHELHTMKDLIATKKSEQDREQRAREKTERELKEARYSIEKSKKELQIKEAEMEKLREEMLKEENVLREQKLLVEKTVKDQENLNIRNAKLQQDYEEQILNTTHLLSDNQRRANEMKAKEDELTKYKEEVKNIQRARDGLARKIKTVEDQKLEVEIDRDALRGLNNALEREIETHKRQLETEKKQNEELVRERDLLNKNLIRSTAATQKQTNIVKLHEQTKRNLEQEISAYKEEASKQRKIIYQLEKERDRYINESAQMAQACTGQEEQVKIKDNIIFDYKKKVADVESRLKQQHGLYETVRTDRNLYSKHLIEAQDEIVEMKRKIKIMGHQIEQLKEEITLKENNYVKEHFEHLKVEKEKEGLKGELSKLKQQYDLAQQFIQNQQAEEQKLHHIITEADIERVHQKKEYDAVIQERDILGTQLIRRNDELALLYEKIKIQQSTLNKGEVQYRERLEDIRVLKLEIKKLGREMAILKHETANVEGLRNEVYRLQRELLRERTKVRVLEEELENPMNIHRWRKLEGADPTTFELIQKIQMLQKRLITKTEEVVEKELVIQTKEKLYKELKNILARQPGPEISEQVNIYQQNLKEKTNQMKALASEVNMYRSEINEYKFEIERVNCEMQGVKKKYYDLRRKLRGSSKQSVINKDEIQHVTAKC